MGQERYRLTVGWWLCAVALLELLRVVVGRPALLGYVEAIAVGIVGLLVVPLTPRAGWLTTGLAGVGAAALALAWRAGAAALTGGALLAGEVLTLMVSVHILGDLFRLAGYDQLVVRLLLPRSGTMTRPRRAQFGGIAAYALALATMAAALPTVYYMFIDPRASEQDRHLGVALTRAFSSAAVLSPLQPTVALALAISGAPLATYLLIAIPVSVLMLGLSTFLIGRQTPPGDLPTALGEEGAARKAGSVPGLIALLLCLGGAVRLGQIAGVGSLNSISLAVVSLSLMWGFAIDRKGFLQILRSYPVHGGLKAASTGALVVAGGVIGFLVGGGQLEPAAQALAAWLPSPWLQAGSIIIVVVVLRFVGVAPPIALLTVGPAMAHATTLGPTPFALALAYGAAMGFLLSPLSLSSMLTAGITGAQPLEISLRPNKAYAVLITLFVVTYATWLQAVL